MMLQTLLQCFSIKTRHRPRLRVVGEHVPMVDVLITCAGEEVAVIMDTLRAAAGVDWPQDRLRVVVLDDKSSEEVRREVQLLSSQNSSVHYTARKKTKGVPHHFKAGNLNHGLNYVEGIEGGKAEYVAALDADMIVERCWLRAILAHLLTDPALALACPPQVSQPHSPYPWCCKCTSFELARSLFRLISSSCFITYQRMTHFFKTWHFSLAFSKA